MENLLRRYCSSQSSSNIARLRVRFNYNECENLNGVWKHLEKSRKQNLELIGEKDICSIIRNRERKHLIIVK